MTAPAGLNWCHCGHHRDLHATPEAPEVGRYYPAEHFRVGACLARETCPCRAYDPIERCEPLDVVRGQH